ncbi:MAG: class I tRNA ligase family protein [Candidatus Doudnabacteria bacterium]|nr:class I tRNA ligase family protein [Candidatus Doudnabacteria bacterium]
MQELPKSYNHTEVENKIYEKWMKSGYFNPDKLPDAKTREPFTISLPPPNVTGILHMGHAFEDSIQDTVIRYQRMRGRRALWVPGTDHAAIATQAKFEKEIYKKEKKSRHDYSREEFFNMINKFALENQSAILSQLHKMGLSLDWSRLAFTLDEKRETAVRTAFKEMYEAGLIYRGHRIVNWDVKGQTTVSDDEIEYEETKGTLYTFKYSGNFPIAVSTTRPETKLGDTAVAVHPDDERYRQFIGQEFDTDFCGEPLRIKIIADKEVDPAFGTGALGVTPMHSFVDWEMAERHNLPKKQVIDEFGKIMAGGPELKGKKIIEARKAIVEILKTGGLLIKEEIVPQNIAHAQRTGGLIEPLPKEQWFIDVNKKFKIKNSKLKGIRSGQDITLKDIMRKVVESGQVTIMPERFEKTYYHWIDNLRDWCISRQIIYGHQIPVWYCHNNIKTMGFSGDIVSQVYDTKTLTYRLRDHGLSAGDKVTFEDSATKKFFGYGIITEVKKTTVGEIDLKDARHWKTYKKREELIAAFKRHHPEKEVAESTPAWLYTYKFHREIPSQGCGKMIVSVENPITCPYCGQQTLEQDPDTLDTWFSSGLWTFSTLGWPDETSDLRTFHPTSVMMPGYEILFFWVARMILMSGFLLGDIPFHKVYLHGIVRESKGKKFSKSLNNGIDPLEMNAKYGTDALRMALVFGAAPGNDVIFDEQKVKGMKHFANKLWNISRFVLTNIGASVIPDLIRDPNLDSRLRGNDKLTNADKDILEKLDAVIKSTTDNLENFQLHEAAQGIYQFTWHEFADIYIEASKAQLKDEKLKESTYYLLLITLTTCLKLLHPFMPFVTEEIWGKLREQKLVKNDELLMVTEWPK